MTDAAAVTYRNCVKLLTQKNKIEIGISTCSWTVRRPPTTRLDGRCMCSDRLAVRWPRVVCHRHRWWRAKFLTLRRRRRRRRRRRNLRGRRTASERIPGYVPLKWRGVRRVAGRPWLVSGGWPVSSDVEGAIPTSWLARTWSGLQCDIAPPPRR